MNMVLGHTDINKIVFVHFNHISVEFNCFNAGAYWEETISLILRRITSKTIQNRTNYLLQVLMPKIFPERVKNGQFPLTFNLISI